MSLINHNELKRQIQTGEFTSLDNIADEFKNIMRIKPQQFQTTI